MQEDVVSLEDVYWVHDSRAHVIFVYRLLQEDVVSLEDVYWVDDSRAHVIFGRKFSRWSEARLSLPANKDSLGILKEELWSTVVKSSDHQDAWTMGK